MNPTLKNTFSWSVSRDSVFRVCPRKYFFNYYGHWGGWLKDASPRTRQVYVLKQLKNRATWIGQIVHDCIARTLRNISRGVPVLGLDEILSITRNLMRQDYRHSTKKRYWQNPRGYCGLFEHEYDIEVTDAQWRNAAEDVDHCLKTFYQSEHYERFRRLPPAEFLEVEQFSSFYVDGFELKMKLDCAIREDENVVVWDWKTGKKESDTGLSLQMGCYALYAKDTFRVELDKILTRRFDLHRGILHEHSITQRSLDEMITYVRGSISDMVALLDNVEENTVREDRFTKVERPEVCLTCNFLRVCQPRLP
ncbi:MAG: PD-(D/E)XK nuclease family protein [Candidatus Latescibacterota bacterium]|nr:MAG: PD-(D/E)XK nuclease family protein [Candidatus Latescibacterota bacterium]